jgi:iron complex outermembrane receptor protein
VNRAAGPNGGPAADGWSLAHGGFRADWDLSPRDTLTVEGDFLHVRAEETLTSVISSALPFDGTFNSPVSVDAGNVLGRWKHTLANGSDTSLQVYYYGHRRNGIGVDDSLHTADFDFQHHLHAGSRNEIVWGAGYRFSDSVILPGYAIRYVPARRADSLYSAFFQDEIKLSDAFSLTVGSKFEHNSYTGFENEPSAQLVWTPTGRQTVWVSAAKAIREPAQGDVSVQVDATTIPLGQGRFGLVTIAGNPNAKSEEMRDFEAGYRAQVSSRFTLDFTGFLSFYKHLQTSEPQASFFAVSPGPPHLVFPSIFEYRAHARDYGAEFFANWNVTSHWRLSPGVTLLNMSVTRDRGSQDSSVEQTPGFSPRRQFQVRSMLDLTHKWQWDQTIGYVSALPAGNILAYVRLDTRLGWRLGESLEFSVVGQNLLRPRHAEFPDTLEYDHTLLERSVFGKILWHF